MKNNFTPALDRDRIERDFERLGQILGGPALSPASERHENVALLLLAQLVDEQRLMRQAIERLLKTHE